MKDRSVDSFDLRLPSHLVLCGFLDRSRTRYPDLLKVSARAHPNSLDPAMARTGRPPSGGEGGEGGWKIFGFKLASRMVDSTNEVTQNGAGCYKLAVKPMNDE